MIISYNTVAVNFFIEGKNKGFPSQFGFRFYLPLIPPRRGLKTKQIKNLSYVEFLLYDAS